MLVGPFFLFAGGSPPPRGCSCYSTGCFGEREWGRGDLEHPLQTKKGEVLFFGFETLSFSGGEDGFGAKKNFCVKRIGFVVILPINLIYCFSTEMLIKIVYTFLKKTIKKKMTYLII